MITSTEPKQQRTTRGVVLRAYLAGVLSCATLLFLVSCEARFTNKNIEVVNQEFAEGENPGKGGVSPKEVEAILGPPKRVEPYRLELETQKKVLDGVRYYYEQDGEMLEIHFLDNKLISRVPKLGMPPREGEKKED